MPRLHSTHGADRTQGFWQLLPTGSRIAPCATVRPRQGLVRTGSTHQPLGPRGAATRIPTPSNAKPTRTPSRRPRPPRATCLPITCPPLAAAA